MTRDQIATNVKSNLDSNGLDYFGIDEINNSIQDAYDDIAVVSGCIQKVATLPWQANVTYYDLVDEINDFFAIVAAYNNNNNQWMNFQGLLTFDKVRQDWELWEGEPLFGAVLGPRKVTFVPRKSTASGNATLYYRATAPTLAGSTAPLVHLDCHELLEWYATGDLFDQAQEFTKADGWWSQYFSSLLQYRTRVGRLAQSDYLPILGANIDV